MTCELDFCYKPVVEVDEPLALSDIDVNYPVVLRGYVSTWPMVECAKSSISQLSDYLLEWNSGEPLQAMVASPKEAGRLFYSGGGFNFERMQGFLGDAISVLKSQADVDNPVTFYIGSTSIPEHFPGMESECLLPTDIPRCHPNIWIGNSTVVATHNDNAKNIACVASGSRTFTLFPPGQEENLYISSNPSTPAGRPVSMVNLRNPDVEKFPNFPKAAEDGIEATLHPGDAIFIPKLWWHGVEAQGACNVLVNFWWND